MCNDKRVQRIAEHLTALVEDIDCPVLERELLAGVSDEIKPIVKRGIERARLLRDLQKRKLFLPDYSTN